VGGVFEILASTGIAGLRAARRQPAAAAQSGFLRLADAGFTTHAAVFPRALRSEPFLAALAPTIFPQTGRRAPELSIPRPEAHASRTLAEAKRLVDAAAQAGGRHLILIFADELLPSFELSGALVDSLDATPWVGAPKNTTIEEHRSSRRQAVVEAAKLTATEWKARANDAPDDLRRVTEAAHANLDAWLGALLAHAESNLAEGRLCMALTASSATALGDGGAWGIGAGIRHESISVPLWIWSGGAGSVSTAPVSPSDLGHTVASAFGLAAADDSRSVDLFGEIPPDRVRVHVGHDSGGAVGFCDGTLRYLYRDGGEALLFDLLNDPGSLVDLHASQPALTERCQMRLSDLLGASELGDTSVNPPFDLNAWLRSASWR
jgi:hypothetical protein